MAEYFSHDYDAREDKKVIKLLAFGSWSFYGMYWAIVEMLYKNDGYLENDYESIAYALRTNDETISIIVNNFELFIVDGNLFYSESVLNRLKLRADKSSKARDSANKRWGTLKKMRPQCERKAIAML